MDLKIKDRFGIHARVATEIVNLVARYGANIEFVINGKHVTGDSIIGLMQLGTKQGDVVHVRYLSPLKNQDEFENFLSKIIEG